MEFVRVAKAAGSVESDRSGHCNYTQLEGASPGRGNFSFTRELITFFLYGKIPPKSSKSVFKYVVIPVTSSSAARYILIPY